jgi:glycosyltransferase involved in cell wall biosynthesis/SAM-dependent methyltransferase
MAKALRITYLFESTALWGGNKAAIEQAEALSERGCAVNILSKDSGPSWYPLKLPVTPVAEFNSSTIPQSDIIVGTFWPTVRAAYESGRGIPVHLCQGYEAANKELLPQKDAIDEVYSYRIPKLTVSPHMDRFLKERFDAETYYVGHMLNRDIFYPRMERPRDDSVFKILVVGPFEADVKNIPVALEGISLAKGRIKGEVKVIRVSQFPLSFEEAEIMRPDVYHFHLPHYSMGEIYRDSDLLVSVSKEAEGFGLPALEAMGSGVPVVLSRIPSYTSFDENRDYALFVEPWDAKALAAAVVKLHSDGELRARLAQRGLEVAERFTKESVVERLLAAFEEIYDRDRLAKTKKAWNDFHTGNTAGKRKYWWDSPVVLGHCQRLVTGDPNMNIYDFLKREFGGRTFERGLSICSGSGEFERGLLDNHICRAIDAYEIAEERVREGERIAREKNYAIRFHAEDVNRAVFRNNHYDIFFSWSALHHVEKLEDVCKNTRNALKDGGLVVVQEYIGPNQFQWTERQVALVNSILETLPERLRISAVTGQRIGRIERPTVERMNSSDPSEAIRSKEIIPVLERFFAVRTVRYFGGSIFNPLFNEIIGNFDHDDDGDVALMKMSLLLEEVLIREKILDNDYAVIIAEKK